MDMLQKFTAAAAIEALALGSGSNCLASLFSGGVELGINVFTPNVVDNKTPNAVLEGYACESLILLTVIHK